MANQITACHVLRLLNAWGRSSLARPYEVICEFVLGKDMFVNPPTGREKSQCYAALPFVFDALRETSARAAADGSVLSFLVVLFKRAWALWILQHVLDTGSTIGWSHSLQFVYVCACLHLLHMHKSHTCSVEGCRQVNLNERSAMTVTDTHIHTLPSPIPVQNWASFFTPVKVTWFVEAPSRRFRTSMRQSS